MSKTTFYKSSYDIDETCSLGCKHRVYYYEVVEVEFLESANVIVDYGGAPCPSAKMWYADTGGMIHFRDATWDGPGWPVDETGEAWMPRPYGEVMKDMEGNIL